MNRRIAVLAVSGTLLAGCNGFQNVMGGDGAESANFMRLFTLFMIVCTVMYLIVAAALLAALWRRRRSSLTVDERRHHQTSHMVRPALIAWTVIVVTGLTVLTVASFFTDRSNAAIASKPAIHMTVTANQWWWDVEYNLPDVSKTLRTANEIHLPVNVPVHVTLKSSDVIHSFWIPNLSGKEDLIPGHANAILLTPRVAGRFRGQCAEFCGLQHAHMALDVQVDAPAAFDQWKQRQLQPARMPMSPDARLGAAVFASTACASCHAIRGTDAGSRVGPDLTHLASRRTLAAGALPMDRASLAAWIADPQHFKPGANMPAVPLSPSQSAGVVEYLMELQ